MPSIHSPALRLSMLLTAAALLLCSLLLAPAEATGQTTTRQSFAVIVHPSTGVGDVSLAQLRRIFLGEQQFWPGGDRIVLLVHAPGRPARGVVLHHLYRMSEGEFKRYWIGKIFRDDITMGPKIVSSGVLARRLTASIPGAISVVHLSEVDASVKVLTVDRHLPGSEGYPLVQGAN